MKQSGDQQADRDIFNIDNKGTVTVINQPVPQRPRNESILLQAIKDEVNGRLDQSLHNAVLINLGKQAQPEQVKRPWDAEVKIGSKPAQPLAPETTILEIFDRQDIAGRLLILGNPGSGKTTTMLDLAQALIQKAAAETIAPIPVLLNLSSWKDPRLELKDWLLEELKSKYGVKKQLGEQWLQDKQLLPLLDGLDEVKPEHQESCVKAINQWLQSDSRPMSLLVCSRREEYINYATRLDLNGAILLQALTEAQIQDYLTSVQMPNLWQVLQQNIALFNLLRTPLLLSITVLSYEELSLAQWQHTTSTPKRLELLLDDYIQKMLHREINRRADRNQKAPTAKQTRHWLKVLAKQMRQEAQTEFLIEKMQPKTWLLTRNQKWIYRLIVGLSGGLIVGLSGGLSGGLIVGLSGGLIFGLSGGLIFGLKADIETRIRPNQGIWNSAQNTLKLTILAGLLTICLYFFLPLLLSSFLNKREIGSIMSGVLALPVFTSFYVGGGLACIQHVALRFVLTRSNSTPWNYARFLNYCTERLLLQRIGGRYRFMHKLLQDHFAEMGSGE
jgi:hypothetical protein